MHTYGLMVALGFLAGFYFSRQVLLRSGFTPDAFDYLIIATTLGGIFGARLFYFILVDPHSLFSSPLQFFRIWEGGLVYYGSFVGGLAGILFFSKKRNVPLLTISDAFAAPLLLAQSIGRLGCFFAGCCYGKPTDLFWGVTFNNPASLAPPFIPLHPTQLYSAFGNFALFVFLFLYSKSAPRAGILTALYMILYGVFRFLIEFLRGDNRGAVLGFLHPSQIISMIAIGAGFGLFYWVKRRASK